MFIGHYGVSFATKATQKRVPLWLLFLAVQWLDIVWSGLVMLGIEKLRIVPGFTASNPMDLYYMPYTHGLPGALALAAGFGAIGALFYRDRRSAIFAVLAGAVFSHWLLDLLVHVEDLPLWGDSFKVGFGLWRNLWISFPLEIATLVAGAVIYARAIPSGNPNGNVWLWGFVAALIAVQTVGTFAMAPTSPEGEARMALLFYLLLAGLAAIVDWAHTRTRATRSDFRLHPAG
ncbi:MAG: hypothetical protein JSR60_17950 [Proteobacteria bacterium]|nr:hypothetical protein [Pseudomonadota bacterium]